MTTVARAQLPNAIFLILGSDDATIPEVTPDGLIWASENALIVGGTNYMDGKITIEVSTSPPEQELIPLEPHRIHSRSGRLSLETVDGEILGQYIGPAGMAKIVAWVDDLVEPGMVHLQINH
jgi:hypothetical protein